MKTKTLKKKKKKKKKEKRKRKRRGGSFRKETLQRLISKAIKSSKVRKSQQIKMTSLN
jgi:hypothetical protein